MSDLIVARRENGCAAMSVGESGLAPALADGSVGAGAAPRAAVHPPRISHLAVRVGPGRRARSPLRIDGGGNGGQGQHPSALSLFHLGIPGTDRIVSRRMSHENESAFRAREQGSASWKPPTPSSSKRIRVLDMERCEHGLDRISMPPDRSPRGKVVTVKMQYGRYDAG